MCRLGEANAAESKWESRADGNELMWKAGFIVMVVVVVGTESRSFTTTASNWSWSVPRDALVAIALVDRGDGFGLVRAKELHAEQDKRVVRKEVEQGTQFGRHIRDMPEGASWSDDSSGCRSRSCEAV